MSWFGPESVAEAVYVFCQILFSKKKNELWKRECDFDVSKEQDDYKNNLDKEKCHTTKFHLSAGKNRLSEFFENWDKNKSLFIKIKYIT